jgi:hypothetical protein
MVNFKKLSISFFLSVCSQFKTGPHPDPTTTSADWSTAAAAVGTHDSSSTSSGDLARRPVAKSSLEAITT